MGVTQLADIIVPEHYTQYGQLLTKERTAFLQAGVMESDPFLDNFLANGGLTIHLPRWKDLANDEDRTPTSDPTNVIADDGTGSAPNAHGKIGTLQEIAVRLERNFSWSAMDLTRELAGSDPVAAILERTSSYWARRLQFAAICMMQGVFADNAAAPTGSDTHTQNDMTVSIIGGAYSAGVTDFSAEAFIDAQATMGDAAGDLVACVMHSAVYNRARKNNLIDFIPDSNNPAAGVNGIPFFQGLRVIQDDGMPNPAGTGAAATSAGIFHTWLLGRGAIRLGMGSPPVGTELERKASSGNGGGQTFLYNRHRWCLHPTGYAYIGTSPEGGPTNGTGSNNLGAAGSWSRRYTERKQISIARLITRES